LFTAACAHQATAAAIAQAPRGATEQTLQTLGVDREMPPPVGPGLSGAELEQATEALASQLRCPVCQGLSIAASPSESAQAMRGQIRQLLADGYSPDQIVEYFERSYGEFVRLSPKPRGFNLVVFVLPVVALAVGLLLVVLTVRRRSGAGLPSKADASGSQGDTDTLDAYRERVRRELSG
jgi:cytochrome c-type biogenesis protein CcmH